MARKVTDITTCDKCGKNVEWYLRKTLSMRLFYGRVSLFRKRNEYAPQYDEREASYDLCRDCILDLKKWIESGKG